LSGAVARAAAHVPSPAHDVVAVMSSARLDVTTGHGRDRGAAGEIAVKAGNRVRPIAGEQKSRPNFAPDWLSASGRGCAAHDYSHRIAS
jgi:hypothetical protein